MQIFLYHLKRRLLIFSILFCSSLGKAELVDGIAAIVNEDIITFSDIKDMVSSREVSLHKMYSAEDPVLLETLKKTRKDALDELIERRLIIQQFNSKGGKVPENMIEDEIQLIIDNDFDRQRTAFIHWLEALGLNLEAYKTRIREKIIVRYMRHSEVNDDEIFISPYKIEKYYDEHLDEFKEGEKVKLRMLYIKNGSTDEETEGARSLSQEILLKLTTGSDFESLASVYSEGPEKPKGGELGFVSKDTLREELADVAFSLKAGQVSKVIETKDGFYILQVEEKKSAKIHTLEESRDLIEKQLFQLEREQLQKRWVQTLRKKAYIRLY